MQRKGRRSRRHGRDNGGDGKGRGNTSSGGGDGEIRFRVQTYLQGAPGIRRDPEGEPLFIITAAERDGSIETIAFNTQDTTAIITDALIALSHQKNEFATYLLTKYFMHENPYLKDEWGRNDF